MQAAPSPNIWANALITLAAAFLGSGVAAVLVQRFLRSEKEKNPDLWGARFKAAQELIPALDLLESSVYSSTQFMAVEKDLKPIWPQLQQLQNDLHAASLKQMGAFGEVFQRNMFCLPPEILEQINDFQSCHTFLIAKFILGAPEIIGLSPTIEKIKSRSLKEGRETMNALRESIQTSLSQFLQVS